MASPLERHSQLSALKNSGQWDLIIIGGGATGLGAAVDAATRGYKTLLLEAYDFAKGTSSRSTKLVHGGVRYLAQGNIGLVREALRERGLMRRNAPHLVRDLGFVVPAYDWWAGPYYGVGLKLYDLLAGKLNLGSSKQLGRNTALKHTPTLRQDGLRGGILYYDGQFDDARLAVTLLRTFLAAGGTALNYLPVTGLSKTEGRISRVHARNAETGEEFELSARGVINATGVFVDGIRRMDDANVPDMLSLSQGVHLVVDKRFLPGNSAVMIPRTDDGRVLFAVPWHDRVVLGTTDTPVERASIEPRPLSEEVEFILRTAARYLNPAPERADVLSVFTGLRPLVKAEKNQSTAALSRGHVLRVAESGLVTITGGKWTTYRKMGEDTINKSAEVAGLPPRECRTHHLKLHGWSKRTHDSLQAYGSDANELLRLEGADRKLHSALPYLEAEVRWSARFELARTVEDVLSRRTRALLLNACASLEAAPRVAELLAEELGYGPAWQAEQIRQYEKLALAHLLPESQEEPKLPPAPSITPANAVL